MAHMMCPQNRTNRSLSQLERNYFLLNNKTGLIHILNIGYSSFRSERHIPSLTSMLIPRLLTTKKVGCFPFQPPTFEHEDKEEST